MLITNVTIATATREIPNADIEIKNGRISRIMARPGVGTRLVVPGFIDVHLHGYGGDDVMDSAAALARILHGLPRHGVTGLMPVVMTSPWPVMKKALAHAGLSVTGGTRNLGIHVEGPFIALAKKGAHDPAHIILPDSALFAELQAAAHGRIRKMTIAPEFFTPAHYKVLRRLGIKVSLGHTNATYAQAQEAIAHGARSATHLWNAMSGVVNRDQGVVTAVLNSDKVYAELLADLMHLDVATLMLSLRAKGVFRIIGATDALKAAGTPDGFSVSGGLPVEKHGIKITLRGTNTIAGSGATMHDIFVNLVRLGQSLPHAVLMTSTNAARWLGEKLGQVAEDYPADLIVMDKASLAIHETYVAGKLVYAALESAAYTATT